MDSTGKILIVLAALVVVIGVGAAYELSTDDDDNDDGCKEAGIVDHWYEVGYYGYYGDTYYAVDTAKTGTLGQWDLDILSYNENDRSVIAVYQDTDVMGTYADGHLTIRASTDTGTEWLNLFVDGNMMYGTNCRATADHTKAFYVVYSTDRNAAVSNPTLLDLSGAWQSDVGLALKDGQQVDRGASVLTVTEQKGMVFRGTLALTAEGTSLPVIGAFTQTKVGDYYQAYMVCDDENWNVLIKDDNLVAVTAADHNGTLMAVERSYVRDDGSGAGVTAPALTGTAWTYQSNHYYYSGIIELEAYEGLYMTVTKQVGPLFQVSFCLNDLNMTGYGFCYGGDDATVGLYVGSGETSFYFCGTVDDGLMDLGQWYDGQNNSLCVFTMTARDPLADPTGYWRAAHTRTVDGEGEVDTADGYDLDVFACRDGLCWGTYGGTAFSGTYTGGWLSFRATLADGTVADFTGRFSGDRTLLANEVRWAADGSGTAVTTVFTTQQLEIANCSVPASPLVGTWNLADGYAYEFADGQKNELVGTTITIEQDTDSGAFVYGTMAQQVAGKLVMKTFTGTLNGFGTGIGNWATIVDSGGLIFRLGVQDGVLYATALTVSDTGTEGLVAIERTYTADGSVPALPDYYQVAGTTWQATESEVLTPAGEYADLAGSTLTIKAQYQNLFSGTLTVDGKEYALVGSIEATGTITGGRVTVDNGTSTPITAMFDGKTLTLYGYVSPDGQAAAFRIVLTLQE